MSFNKIGTTFIFLTFLLLSVNSAANILVTQIANYAGIWQDENVTLNLVCNDFTCTGSADILGAKFPITAVIDSLGLTGEMQSGNTDIGFTAFFESNQLRFTTGDRSYLLSRNTEAAGQDATENTRSASSMQAPSMIPPPAEEIQPTNNTSSSSALQKHLNIPIWNMDIGFSWDIEVQKTAMVNHRIWSIITAPSARIEYYILPGPFQHISDALGDIDILKSELGLIGNLSGAPKSIQVFNLPAIQFSYKFKTENGTELIGFVTTIFGFRKSGVVLFTLAETVDTEEAKGLSETILNSLVLGEPLHNSDMPHKSIWKNATLEVPESIVIDDNGGFTWEKPGQATTHGTSYQIGNTLILDTGSIRYCFYLSDSSHNQTLSRGETLYTN